MQPASQLYMYMQLLPVIKDYTMVLAINTIVMIMLAT